MTVSVKTDVLKRRQCLRSKIVLCWSIGDTERRVAFYDFETGKYKDDVQSSYQWEGEATRIEFCLRFRLVFVDKDDWC